MLWYNGSVKKAVEEVRSSGLPFLVFIQGDDKLSEKYETFLNDEAVFNNKKCIAVKIGYDSVAHKQFKAIYNTVPVPSVFMIGSNGIPVDVLCYETTSEALHNKINGILEKFVNNGHKNDAKNVKKPAEEKIIPEEKSGIDFLKPDKDIKKRLEEIRSSPRFYPLDPPIPPSPSITNSNQCLKSLSARIQFRLPSNEMPSWEFPNEATLRDVKIYLSERLKLKNNFKLLKTYPRVAFSPEDDDKTLAELNLIPSASLIVVPVQDEAVQAKIKNFIAQPNIVTTLVVSIIQPFINIFTNLIGYIRNIFQPRQPPREDPKENPVRRMQSDTSVEKRINKKTSTSNVHGFKFDRDSDSDEINTDNGNSTQQQ